MTQPIEGDRVEITKKLHLFSLHHAAVDPEHELLVCLRALQQYADQEFVMDNQGSAIYFFRAGNSVIELDISVEETVDIRPHVCYHPDHVQEDLEQLLYTDRFLHAFFKQIGLQG